MVAQDLIADVHRSSRSGEPLDLLATAIVRSDELVSDADALVDHFVVDARRAGHSWTEIGERLGVSKQAVRERFGGRASLAGRERFMPRLQHCIAAAGVLAACNGHLQITVEHLLVALASNEGVAGDALRRLGATGESIARVAGISTAAVAPAPDASPPESADVTTALGNAAWFAVERGHDYVGTEHVLFVLATDQGTLVPRLLEQLGVHAADVKRELSACIGNRRRRRRKDRRRCSCSFCGAADALLFGHGVRICPDCARLALELGRRTTA